MLDTDGKVRKNSQGKFSNGYIHMDTPALANKHKLIFTKSMQTLRYSFVEIPIGTDGNRESKESLLLVHLDDDVAEIFS